MLFHISFDGMPKHKVSPKRVILQLLLYLGSVSMNASVTDFIGGPQVFNNAASSNHLRFMRPDTT